MPVSEYNFIEEKIRRKCREEHWYGPSSFKGKEGRVAWAHPFSFTSDFAFPPATEQELHETETILGFRLPPLLRALYGVPHSFLQKLLAVFSAKRILD
jgi:hypothetical protein